MKALRQRRLAQTRLRLARAILCGDLPDDLPQTYDARRQFQCRQRRLEVKLAEIENEGAITHVHHRKKPAHQP